MDNVKAMLDKKLDDIYSKVNDPYTVHKNKLLELQKDVLKTNDILKLQIIMRQVEKISKNIKYI
jgi:hypothetical protein